MRSCLAPFTVSKQSKSCSFCLCCFALAFVFLPFYFRCFTPFILFTPLIHHVPHYDRPLRRACWRTCATQTLWPCTTSSTPRPPSPSSSSSSPLTFPRWAAIFSDVVKCANKVFQFLAPTNPSGFLVCQGLSEHSLQRWSAEGVFWKCQTCNNCTMCNVQLQQLQQLHIHQNFSLCGNSYEKAFTTSSSYWACCKVKQGQWITWSKVIMQQNQTHRSVWSVTVCYLITVANLVGCRPDNRKNLQK